MTSHPGLVTDSSFNWTGMKEKKGVLISIHKCWKEEVGAFHHEPTLLLWEWGSPFGVGDQGCDSSGRYPAHRPRGSRQAFGTYKPSRQQHRFHSSPGESWPGTFVMASHVLLQQLHRLDRSSPRFHDKLSNVLSGEEYKNCTQNLRDGDLVWLVDYLDKVCRRIPCLALHLNQARPSMISILPVPVSGNVSANLGTYVAPG
jgi:hypothetical protein